MSSLTSLNRSMLRLSGVSSGMDTESIVSSLLRIDQMKVDKQFKAKTTLQWKGDAYRDVNLKLRSFREKYMSVLSPATNIFSSAAYKAFKVNMVDESMSKYVTISAGSNAQQGSVSINRIEQLAAAAQEKSRNIWANGATPSLETKLGAELEGGGSVFGNEIEWSTRVEYTYWGTEDEFDQEMYDAALAQYENEKADWVSRGNDEASFPMERPIEDYRTRTEIKEVSIKINDEEFTFTSENTINEVMAAINSRSNVGVIISYSSLTEGFTIAARSTGKDAGFTLENTLGKFFAEETGGVTEGGAFGISVGSYEGKNAIMYIDDDEGFAPIRVERSSNSFSIDGIEYNLKQTFNVDGTSGDRIKFNVQRDIEPVFEKIKGFIEGYNALIEELQKLYDQKPNRNYSPLTDDETSQLSEKEAEKWQGLAKEGLLYRDNNIAGLLSTMRGAFYDTVQGLGRSAADIGLRTSAYDYAAGGKIVIDENALRSALMSNPEQVMDVFTKLSSAEDSGTQYKESGLVVRLSTAINSYISNVNDITLASNSRQLKEATSRYEQLETWLADRETRYWRQFTAMETAMASLNSQSSWIGNMLGSN